MKKIRLFPILLLVCLLFSMGAPAAFALAEPDIGAQAALVVDLNSGRVIYDKSMHEQRAPASLTKVMTVLLALEAIQRGECTMEDQVTAQEDCREGMDEDSSTAGIEAGDVLSMRDLLYCAMLSSANEACNIIGSYLAGSVSAFVDRMNERATQLGCTDTHFMNTNGLPAEGHYSSAYDMYLITREAVNFPLFLEMANTLEYQPTANWINNGEPIRNSNALINPTSDYGGNRYLYAYASGVKTGYTRAAGYCLISTAEKDGVRALVVVMGCDGWLNAHIEEYRNFSDTISLYDWTFDNFEYRTVLSKKEPLTTATVDLAKGDGQVSLYPQEEVTYLLPSDLDVEDIRTEATVYEDRLRAPLEAGSVLGEAKILVNGEEYGTVRLVNNVQVELARGEFMRLRLKEFFSKGWVITVLLVLLVLAAGYILLVTRYRRLRRKHLEARRRAEQHRKAAMERVQAEARLKAEFSEDWDDIR